MNRSYRAGFRRFQKWHFRVYGTKFGKDGYNAFRDGFRSYRDKDGRTLKLLKKRTDVCEACEQLRRAVRNSKNATKKAELQLHLDRHIREAEHHRIFSKLLMLAVVNDTDHFLFINTDCAAQFTLPRFKEIRHNGDYRATKDSVTRFIIYETATKTANTYVWSKIEGGKVSNYNSLLILLSNSLLGP